MTTAATTQTTAPKASTRRDALRMLVSSSPDPLGDRQSQTCGSTAVEAETDCQPRAASLAACSIRSASTRCSRIRGLRRSSIPTATWRGSAGRGSIRPRCSSRYSTSARWRLLAAARARPDARVVSRRYHSRSLVLETVWQVGDARLIVDDALDLGDGPLLVRSMRAWRATAVAVMVGITAPSWPGTPASLRMHGRRCELDGVARVAIHAPVGVGSRRRMARPATSPSTGSPGNDHARQRGGATGTAARSTRRWRSGGGPSR